MLYVLCLIIGLIVGAIFASLVAIPAARRAIMREHGAKMLEDEQKYQGRWTEAVTLLSGEGRITDEQLGQLMPPEQPIVDIAPPQAIHGQLGPV